MNPWPLLAIPVILVVMFKLVHEMGYLKGAIQHHDLMARYNGALAEMFGRCRDEGREPHYSEVLAAVEPVWKGDPFMKEDRPRVTVPPNGADE